MRTSSDELTKVIEGLQRRHARLVSLERVRTTPRRCESSHSFRRRDPGTQEEELAELRKRPLKENDGKDARNVRRKTDVVQAPSAALDIACHQPSIQITISAASSSDSVQPLETQPPESRAAPQTNVVDCAKAGSSQEHYVPGSLCDM